MEHLNRVQPPFDPRENARARAKDDRFVTAYGGTPMRLDFVAVFERLYGRKLGQGGDPIAGDLPREPRRG